MDKKDQKEEIIKQTTNKLFFKQGKFRATTNDIAEAAGVNRTLINYYFRSRDNLIRIVFEEAKATQKEKLKLIVASKGIFKKKIEDFIDYTIQENLENPYLEAYIVSMINQGEINIMDESNDLRDKFFLEIVQEMEKGTIEKMDPVQFMLNLFSLLNFPITMKPLLKKKLKLDDNQYNKMLMERREIILKVLFKN